LTHCEFSSIRGLLLASFTDSERPDSITLSGFRTLLKLPDVPNISGVDNKIAMARLKAIASRQQKDNLFV
jgi:hypothetical protein